MFELNNSEKDKFIENICKTFSLSDGYKSISHSTLISIIQLEIEFELIEAQNQIKLLKHDKETLQKELIAQKQSQESLEESHESLKMKFQKLVDSLTAEESTQQFDRDSNYLENDVGFMLTCPVSDTIHSVLPTFDLISENGSDKDDKENADSLHSTPKLSREELNSARINSSACSRPKQSSLKMKRERSLEIVSSCSDSDGYKGPKYQAVVRRKLDRKQMHGVDCPCCSKVFQLLIVGTPTF